ncbi:Serine proteinase stubblelike, partial [Caligus rogercresseyi]
MLFGLLAMAFGRPQDVDVSDILGAANAARYGGNEEPADSSLVDDVFGGDGKTNNNNNNNNGNGNGSGGPYANGEDELHVNEIVDTSYEECSYYADQGYKCVPYYTCEDGEIVTDGGGLIDIRSSFSAILDPGSSKCEGIWSTNAPIVKTTTKKPTTPKPRVYVPQCGRRNIGGIG